MNDYSVIGYVRVGTDMIPVLDIPMADDDADKWNLKAAIHAEQHFLQEHGYRAKTTQQALQWQQEDIEKLKEKYKGLTVELDENGYIKR